ncbi:MAG: Uma2 family endonuclease [Chloroflexi bacterium]|nr:Uma2 family endonuclease [Chloroflexota bacterium]
MTIYKSPKAALAPKTTLIGEGTADWKFPDPPYMCDMNQLPHIVYAHGVLSDCFSGREDVLVSGEGYLCHDRRDRSNWVKPDCVVAFSVSPEAIRFRNGYEILEVGKPPEFVLEVASESTGARDYTIKRDIYESFGVSEYWRFDSTGGNFHDAPLAFDLLVDGEYRQMELDVKPDGSVEGVSPALGIGLRWDAGILVFFDTETGEAIPDYTELRRERDAERVRAETAEAELRRLREQLRDG